MGVVSCQHRLVNYQLCGRNSMNQINSIRSRGTFNCTWLFQLSAYEGEKVQYSNYKTVFTLS